MFERVAAYIILHTGSPYLQAALEAIYQQVDNIFIFYSEKPSQGYGTTFPCPDNRKLLKNIVYSVDGFNHKVIWIDGNWANEADHTNAIYKYVDNYAWLVRFDADEIFPDGMVNEMISQAKETSAGLFQFPFLHFWRSFNQCCVDGQFPYRMIRSGGTRESAILDSRDRRYVVYHGGYAIPNIFMEYKWMVTGHKSELRPEWFHKVWYGQDKENLHPVSYGLWPKSEPFDKRVLPDSLKKHPYYHLTKIN